MKKLLIKQTKKVLISALCLILSITVTLSSTINVYALSAEQKKIIQKNILYYDLQVCDNISGSNEVSSGSNLSGSSNAENVYQFFVSKDYKPFQAAAIIGNMTVESGVEPQRQQSIFDRLIPAEQFPTPGGGSGWGIVQWTPGSKFIDPTKAAGKDPNKLDVQLEFLYAQLEGTGPLSEKAAGDQFKATTTIEDAVLAFQGNKNVGGSFIGYERPADQRGSVPERTAAAKVALRKFSSTTIASTVNSSTDGSGCTCTETSASLSGDSTPNGKIVVLDPGHSGKEIVETDPATGITGKDYPNSPEMKDMWEVSQKMTPQLKAAGFTVINTKKSADDTIGLFARARIANDANAAIAISIHSTPGKFGSDSVGWVIPQEVGRYRQTGSSKKTFTDEALARESSDYSNKILAERIKSEGGAKINNLDFKGRGLPATGDISISQLFSKVPWVYNETGQTGIDLDKYAEGLSNGIIAALSGTTTPATDPSLATSITPDSSGCASGDGQVSAGVTGDLASTVKAYAHPEYHQARYLERMPEWAKVADDPSSHYVGGTVAGVKGIDCGGFVTMTLRNSGFDTNYNPTKGSTITGQLPYLQKSWQKINPVTTKDLLPGDVAINKTHTYLFVGKIPEFNSAFASASYSVSGGGRAPMAGSETIVSQKFEWYRKK